MLKLSKMLLGCTASMTLLAVTSVAAAQEVDGVGLPADPVTVALEPMNGTETTGVAMLQEAEEGQTALGLEVLGLEAEDALVAMIVTGTCAEPGEIRAALGVIESDQEGTARGEFSLDDPIENVLAIPSTIRVQPQGPDAEILLCGQIAPPVTEELPDAPPTATPIPDPIPTEEDADQGDVEPEGEPAEEDADQGDVEPEGEPAEDNSGEDATETTDVEPAEEG